MEVGDICMCAKCTQDTHGGQRVRLPGTGVGSRYKLPDLDARSFLAEEQVLLTTRPHVLQLRKVSIVWFSRKLCR